MNDFTTELRLFRNKIISSLKDIKLTQNNPRYFHETIIPRTTYSPWITDSSFQVVYRMASPNTLVDVYRCYNLWDLVKQTNHLQGDLLEVGVWNGGTSSIIGVASNNTGKLYAADTFEGVVKAGENDTWYKGGEHADAKKDEVDRLLKSASIADYEILKGIFPEDFEQRLNDVKIKFCHIDVDVYQSTKDIFNFVWPRLVVNGVVVFDDYGFLGCEGITKFVDELDIQEGIKMYNLNGQAVIVRCGK
jgi:O-methyltransferase